MPEVIINGPAGRIEARYSPGNQQGSPCAIVLHPHPLHGGTMNNKVVYTLYKAFSDNGFSVLRFNFRGVGRSSGEYDNGVGELLDAACAMDWLQLHNQYSNTYWVSGFSFGAWIAMQLLMRRPEVSGFISASPPVNKYDFSFLSPCPASGMIVQGDMDSVVSEEAVSKMAERLSKQRGIQIEYQVIEGADHFFRTQLDELYRMTNQYIDYRSSSDESTNIPTRKTRADRRRRQMLVDELAQG